MRNLTNGVKTIVESVAVAAGTSVVNFNAIDTYGFEGCRVICLLGTIASTGTDILKQQQSSDNGSVDTYDDIAGSAVSITADTDDNKALIIDIYRPGKQWLRPVLIRGTANTDVVSVVVELYLPTSAPVTMDTTVAAQKLLVQPVEGTP